LIGIGRRATITTLCVEGVWRIFKDRLPVVIYTGHYVFPESKFERCVLSDMKIKGTSVSPTLSIDYISISTLLSSDISPYQCLPPSVCSVHFGIEAFLGHIAVKVRLRGENVMPGVGSLPHQPSHAFDDDVSTPVCDRALSVVIPSHILQNVSFPVPGRLIIWHASYKLLDAIPVFEAWEIQSGVFLHQHVVIVCLHALLLDPTLDIFELFTGHKRIVRIVS
jgi:hypothetical protein